MASVWREQVKKGLGWVAGNALTRCRYDNCLFVLAHMRCGSTALSNIVCSRPDVSGFGESHVCHNGPDAPGRLAVNSLRRGGWKMSAPYQFDKVLHSRLDCDAPEDFFGARAIFLVREPEPTVHSIVRLFRKLGRNEYRTEREAAEYYVERLGALARLWAAFPLQHRIGLTHRALLTDPDRELMRISHHLGIDPPLENSYRSRAASRQGGGGDPLVSGKFSRIEPLLPSVSNNAITLDVPDSLRDAAWERYCALQALFAADGAR